MIGVAGTYFISRYGDRVAPRQVAEGLAEVAALGYDAFQLEVFHADTLDEWTRNGAPLLASAAKDRGLHATQFVAHFLLHSFESPESISRPDGREETAKILEIVSRFPECKVITVPLGVFSFTAGAIASSATRNAGGSGSAQGPRPHGQAAAAKSDPQGGHGLPVSFAELRERYLRKLRSVVELIEGAGLRCGVELVPGAFVNGTDGLLKLFSDLGSTTIGYNFDTGHTNAAKENVALVPYKFGQRIFGTHLCDNFGNENLKLCPGDGSIDWAGVFHSLSDVGYTGSLDVEIRCRPEEVRDSYARAFRFIREAAPGSRGNSAPAGQNEHPTRKEEQA